MMESNSLLRFVRRATISLLAGGVAPLFTVAIMFALVAPGSLAGPLDLEGLGGLMMIIGIFTVPGSLFFVWPAYGMLFARLNEGIRAACTIAFAGMAGIMIMFGLTMPYFEIRASLLGAASAVATALIWLFLDSRLLRDGTRKSAATLDTSSSLRG